MTSVCPERDELALLVDGELTENRARAVRGHLQRCSRCREEAEALDRLVADLSAPLERAVGADAVEAILLRLDAAPERPSRSARTPRRQAVALAAGLAAAAAIALVVAVVPSESGDGERHAQVAVPAPPAPPVTPVTETAPFFQRACERAPVQQSVFVRRIDDGPSGVEVLNTALRQLLFGPPAEEQCVYRRGEQSL